MKKEVSYKQMKIVWICSIYIDRYRVRGDVPLKSALTNSFAVPNLATRASDEGVVW